MQSTDLPVKFPIPWANNATPGTGVRAIPTASQIGTTPGAASLTDGFPPLNFIPVGAGGIPPFGQDENGILKQITSWLRWHEAGGPIRYDLTYATSIGGYPIGAVLLSTSGHAWYENLVENNLTDPNLSGANWRVISCVWSAGVWNAAGSANAQLITFTPAATSTAQFSGVPFTFRSIGTNTAPVMLNINALGALQLVASNGTALAAGAIVSNGIYQAVGDGAGLFRLLTPTPVFSDPGTAGLTIVGPGANGANLELIGNGGTTPNKFIRVISGALQFVNSAYSAVIATLTDAGAFTTQADITANTGNITAANGRIRAGIGAFASGDGNAGTILNDFTLTGGTSGWVRLPNGFIIQWGFGATTTGNQDVIIFPLTFPSFVAAIVANEGAASGWNIGGSPAFTSVFGVTRSSNSGFLISAARVNQGGSVVYGTLTAYHWIAIGW